jgi:hypothetical protein
MTRCPSDLELELLLRSPGGEPEHLLACDRCTARLAELRRLGDEFHREVFPATVEAVVAGATRRARPRLAPWLVPLAALAAAAGVALVRVGGPPSGYLGLKGPGLELVAYARGVGGAHPLADGAEVAPGAGLRFQVRPARACRLWIVSADADGQVSRIYPSTGTEGAELPGGKPAVLPGGAALDGRPGPERFFAVCGAGGPLALEDVERSARALGPGAERVRTVRSLPGLPAGAAQASILVEKRP